MRQCWLVPKRRRGTLPNSIFQIKRRLILYWQLPEIALVFVRQQKMAYKEGRGYNLIQLKMTNLFTIYIQSLFRVQVKQSVEILGNKTINTFGQVQNFRQNVMYIPSLCYWQRSSSLALSPLHVPCQETEIENTGLTREKNIARKRKIWPNHGSKTYFS